jgi:demethylmenaquinone methyltransferase / 2-methoxy-6-polyprenyl-1,4-benzoquinol methylase
VDSNDIRRMFSGLAPEYDRFNRWSSLGLDDRWRKTLAREVPPGAAVLDLGCGTGALTRLLADRPKVVGVDFSGEMLRRAKALPGGDSIAWTEASADALPFPDASFDAVVSAYVLRNFQRAGLLEKALAESFRVLRSGGKLLFLDLTRPRNPLLRLGHDAYVRTVVPAVGKALFGARWPGEYLRGSIEELWPPDRLRAAFEAAGFRRVDIRPLWGGTVSLFSGVKPEPC